eukprot:GHVL01040479.1.p1 GENE.GHVL01040479.1~~GHVL01040479.1.p1  ORF type:complete len:258 (+),score=39.36 GHVL01040479.1:97-870(+)
MKWNGAAPENTSTITSQQQNETLSTDSTVSATTNAAQQCGQYMDPRAYLTYCVEYLKNQGYDQKTAQDCAQKQLHEYQQAYAYYSQMQAAASASWMPYTQYAAALHQQALYTQQAQIAARPMTGVQSFRLKKVATPTPVSASVSSIFNGNQSSGSLNTGTTRVSGVHAMTNRQQAQATSSTTVIPSTAGLLARPNTLPIKGRYDSREMIQQAIKNVRVKYLGGTINKSLAPGGDIAKVTEASPKKKVSFIYIYIYIK